jgi:hypothetical protein
MALAEAGIGRIELSESTLTAIAPNPKPRPP